jgi:N-carbamoylputrescine amidase
MPFSRWLSGERPGAEAEVAAAWDRSMEDHARWIGRLGELGADFVAASRPVAEGGSRFNEAFLWAPSTGMRPLHRKRYLPDEEGFWEASWYSRGDPDFAVEGLLEDDGDARGEIRACALICTEIWFTRHARDYGEAGAHILLAPRATLRPSTDKWIAGGRAAAVVSGAFCLSSNFTGPAEAGGMWGGAGWIVDPEEGDVLGTTTATEPFLTVELDLSRADRAKETYPRYVRS